jgi:hypothetical protein
MGSDSSWVRDLGFAWLVARAILFSLLGILLLVGFIVFRRWYRGRYFNRLSERTVALRGEWADILSGRIPGSVWRLNVLDCQIVEDILLDNIEVSRKDQLPVFLGCLRNSGLLDLRIHEARSSEGWRRRSVLLKLGRTRAPEAIPALVEALESPSEETRVAAVRGLGRIAAAQAALPLLEYFVAGDLQVPEHTLKNRASGPAREVIARVLGELATPNLGDELLVLAADALPEVRASAARALGKVQPEISFPVLSTLAVDKEWFVRLRAVIAMGSLDHAGKIHVLLRALCDLNRHVRQRAAWTLARMHQGKEDILEKVVATQDDYALQAFLSELERCGSLDAALDRLGSIVDRDRGAANVENVAAVVREHFAAPVKVASAAAAAGKP